MRAGGRAPKHDGQSGGGARELRQAVRSLACATKPPKHHRAHSGTWDGARRASGALKRQIRMPGAPLDAVGPAAQSFPLARLGRPWPLAPGLLASPGAAARSQPLSAAPTRQVGRCAFLAGLAGRRVAAGASSPSFALCSRPCRLHPNPWAWFWPRAHVVAGDRFWRRL
jgi:hypothetical protein